MDVWQEEEWGVVMRWEYAPPIDVIQFEKYWGLLGSMRNPLHYQRLGAMKCKWWFMGRINPLAGQIMHFPFRPRYVITQSTSDRTFWLGMRTFPHTTSWVHNLLSLSGCYYYFSATCYPPPLDFVIVSKNNLYMAPKCWRSSRLGITHGQHDGKMVNSIRNPTLCKCELIKWLSSLVLRPVTDPVWLSSPSLSASSRLLL